MTKQGYALAAMAAATLFLGGTASAQAPGKSVCMECHERKDLGKVPAYHSDCTSCHSGGEVHVETPDKSTINLPAAGSCLACHGQDRNTINWNFADHSRAGVACRDCHGIHADKRLPAANQAMAIKDKTTATCASCHEEVLARFNMPSHHPIKEGAMTCVSCHNPHGSGQASLTAKTAQCTSCHQSVRGPHMMEHPPAAEDCLSCHNPHGSPNRRMLQVAEPMLCLQCHSVAGNRHGLSGATNNTQRITGAVLRKCTGCHGQIHGSSQDEHLRF